MSGNLLYGFRGDWVNFIQMSQWANENIPKDAIIASRKPEISFIYTGRKFYGIYKVPSFSPDTLMKFIDRDTQSVYIAVVAADILQKKGLEKIFYSYGSYVHTGIAGAPIINDKSNPPFESIVYRFPKNKSEPLKKTLSDNLVPYKEEVNGMIQEYKNKNYVILAYDPDTLLKILKHDNVKYVIMSNMSLSSTLTSKQQKATTISRFIHFIEIKYPILQIVHKIGTSEDETSRLLEIHYERLNTAVVKF